MLGSFRSGLCTGIRLTSNFIVLNTKSRQKDCFKVMFLHARMLNYAGQGKQFYSQTAPINSEKNIELSLDEIVEELCGEDPDAQKKLRVLMLEVEVMRQDGRQAPDKLTLRHWKYLLDLQTKSQRYKYLEFLFKNEKSSEKQKLKAMERKKIYESTPKPEKENPDDMEYGLVANAMFLRIRDSSIADFDNFNAHRASLYGQKIVLDCSYEQHMVPREAFNAAKQITLLFGDNRIHKEPFDIHICNADLKGQCMQQLETNIPPVMEPWFPLNIHKESYLDLFPKEKLVYLTPHCRDELVEFDHEAVYIVGCMVDKVNNEPLSLAKAKRDGLKMAKLPLDRYLEWAPGSGKSLNINHIIHILLDLKCTGDWEYALRHVPRRKLMESKLAAVRKNVQKFNPKFIESLKSSEFKRRYKVPPRVFAGKINIKTLFNDNEKY